ncbi:MAG: LLM class oxidoreductase [Neisseriaceae bacterium]|nr:LLM class oxidoreductase [Neisseriaceae bacterium]MBP6861005.1 LLM class oxidoreductase [Neisseriaceae bacterium]
MDVNALPLNGRSYEAFAQHAGYRRMFAPDRLSLGVFLPQRAYHGDMSVLQGQSDWVRQIDAAGFAAVWVRDVPLFDPDFGDAGQLFDPFTYLAYLAAQTKSVALATGSAIFSLRHPLDLAKAAHTIDQLSGGRLVLGIASGDRAIEFPAYGLEHEARGERFAETVHYFRRLSAEGLLSIDSPLGHFSGAEFLPKAVQGSVPLMVTGASRQPLDWVAQYADGWLTYPEATHHAAGPLRLASKIQAWRRLIPDGGFRPHMTNEWIDLVDDPDYPRTPEYGGYVLKTGRNGLIELLSEWQAAGVNHGIIGFHLAKRPVADMIQELAEEVLPLFPSHTEVLPQAVRW